MKFGRGNWDGKDPYVEGDSCTACYTQTFGDTTYPGYKCVDQLCGKLFAVVIDFYTEWSRKISHHIFATTAANGHE